MAQSPNKLCIFLFGNVARGDDALGEHLHALLQLHIANQPDQYENIKLVLDFQLEPEHIFDLQDANIGIFVDAHHDVASGVKWQQIIPGSQLHFSSHHLPPESLLFLFETTFEQSAPRCYLLSIGGESFELGETLSPLAQRNMDTAFTLLLEKLMTLRSAS